MPVVAGETFSYPSDVTFGCSGQTMPVKESESLDYSDSFVMEKIVCFDKWKPEKLKLETTVSYRNLVSEGEIMYSKARDDELIQESNPAKSLAELKILLSPRPASELDAAALEVQKVYNSYPTRRNLADCAVVIQELWCKALEFAALKWSSVSYFNIKKPESAVSRWTRARTRAAKVGKGLCKDEKAKKLALRHWVEAIDPCHRYGHNLHLYYDVWFNSQSKQPFFYWLDVGDGKEVNLDKCERTVLQHQCIKYLVPKEREAYEVIIESGKLVYRRSGVPVDTIEGTKWIFVLSTSRNLYVGQKKKGLFQHSSFLAGGATTAAGRLVAHKGFLEAIWPYSGHYCPTEENFMEFITFLEDHNVDMTNVKRCAIDDDVPPLEGATGDEEVMSRSMRRSSHTETKPSTGTTEPAGANKFVDTSRDNVEVGEYPPKMQFQALEQVNLSPRIKPGPFSSTTRPIPSPRPSSKIHLSPSLC